MCIFLSSVSFISLRHNLCTILSNFDSISMNFRRTIRLKEVDTIMNIYKTESDPYKLVEASAKNIHT